MYMDPAAKAHSVFQKINEMFILKKFSRHPSIVRVLDFHFTSSHLLIFMELVTGGDLRDQLVAIKPRYLFESFVCKLFRDIGGGLLYMHDAGFVHRDLKPG